MPPELPDLTPIINRLLANNFADLAGAELHAKLPVRQGLINDLLTEPDNRLGQWLSAAMTPDDLVDELYWTALGRAPDGTDVTLPVAAFAV